MENYTWNGVHYSTGCMIPHSRINLNLLLMKVQQ
jgi:hypothetical protein